MRTSQSVLVASIACALCLVLNTSVWAGTKPKAENNFSYAVSKRANPLQQSLIGLNRGPQRTVDGVLGPNGSKVEFITDEVMFRPASKADLQLFLTQYHGTVLRDGTPELIAGLPKPRVVQSSGVYLIRIDLTRSSYSDVATNMNALGFHGKHYFSSLNGVRLIALIARENRHRRLIGFNQLFHTYDDPIFESSI